MDVPESYDPDEVEARWRDDWDDSLYAYDDDPERPDYVIDTPPPYPTGNLHIGNALGWCYMDYAARYKRLQGHDVLYPQGWDCHGLPTEVKVEENEGVKKSEVPRDEFREMCVDHTYEMIDAMRSTMDVLGFSQDWDHEYVTMEPEYWGETQRSFVEMHGDGYAYRDHHPVNWCPRCETAIADAEVEREDREGTLYDIAFAVAGAGDADPAEVEGRDELVIATTRPELLAACGAVAVHPDDERYDGLLGAEIEVPLFGQRVELIADDEVDADFGSGAVMICTFGDKQDVEWWQEHDLELRRVFTKQGTLTEEADGFQGQTIEEAKEAIALELEDAGSLLGSEPIEQSVGICWRCDTPIEILAAEQWFIEVRQDEVLEKAREVDWIPEHAYDRLEDWTTSMEWDWVISRQRVFATPFPVWYCSDCGKPTIADADDCPVDPAEETPEEPCGVCGASNWEPEEDVMDTWMDSSISALYVGGRPEGDFAPTQLREQGHDIIRTWAFYTILRTAAIEDAIPWEDALINGMVFGDDGHKMSKSRGNFVQPEEVVEEHGADAFRQAIASAGRPGSDIQFQWKEVDRASRFVTKLWNIYRFALPHVGKDVYDHPDELPSLRLADDWILSRLTVVADDVATAMDDHRYDEALRTLREFAWNELADDYVELVKGRLYDGEEGEEGYEAVRWTLHTVLEAVVTMLAPIAPFVTEEIHDGLAEGSVHATAWPAPDREDEDRERRGAVQAELVAAIRSWKSDTGMALNADMGRIEVYTALDLDELDVANALNADVWLERGEPDLEEVPTEVDPDMSVIGPAFTDGAGEVVAALEQRDPADVAAERDEGAIAVEVDGETQELEPKAVAIEHELRSGGEDVDVVETDEATAVIFGD